MPKALLVAHVHPASEQLEDEFNRWYDDIHIPQVVERIPGVVGGSRYRYADSQLVPDEAAPERRYLSLYELDTDDLGATAARLGEALGDGTLDMTDAIDMGERGPVLHFFVPTP